MAAANTIEGCIMASPVLEIVPTVQLGTTAAAIYTSPAGVWTQIAKLSCLNTDSVTRTVSFYLVPSGGAAITATLLVSAKAISAGESWNDPTMYGHVLNPGDAIWASASVAAVVNTAVAGIQLTG